MKSSTNHFLTFNIANFAIENTYTRTLILEGELPSAQPGQFVMAWLPGIGEKPFSIAGNNPLLLTVAAVGKVSNALCSLQVGDRIWVRGPLGRGFFIQGQKHLLVGGGYGAAPLAYLTSEILKRDEPINVCLGARCPEDLLFTEIFKTMGCKVIIHTENGGIGERGLVTLGVERILREDKPDQVYACGPTLMLTAIHNLCMRYRVPCQLSWEALIRCGMGLCGSCELDPLLCRNLTIPEGWLVCKDGPVSIWNPPGLLAKNKSTDPNYLF